MIFLAPHSASASGMKVCTPVVTSLWWLLVAQEPWWAYFGHWQVSIELAHCLGPLYLLFRLKSFIFFLAVKIFKKLIVRQILEKSYSVWTMFLV